MFFLLQRCLSQDRPTIKIITMIIGKHCSMIKVGGRGQKRVDGEEVQEIEE